MLAGFALAYAGLAALALAMQRHFGEVFARRKLGPRQVLALRAAGLVLLAASLWACIGTMGPAIGTTSWFGLLSGGGWLLVLGLAARPRWAMALAVMLLAGAV